MARAKKTNKKTKTDTNPLLRDEKYVKAREKVLPVIESLKSGNEKDRKWSTAIISELLQDDTLRLTLLREGTWIGGLSDLGLVNALLDRLTDNNLEVKYDAVDSIDALVLKEGQGTCKELYRKNVLTLLEKLLNEVRPDFTFTENLGICTVPDLRERGQQGAT
jgi:hypothetical protein